MKMNYRYIVAGIVLTAAIAGSVLWIKKNRPVMAPVVQAGSGLKSWGAADAPIQIAEYSDFQCPACRRAQETLHRILETYSGKVKLIFYHYPLPMHHWSGLAHLAAECANKEGKFWEFHDKLFADQKIWSETPSALEMILSYARDMGMDIDKFAACLADPGIKTKVLEDKVRGDGLHLQSTPTFFINGERVVGQVELENRGENLIRSSLGLPPLPPKPVVPPQQPAPTTGRVPGSVQ